MRVEVWADGASCGNSLGAGGWCALVKADGEVHHTAYGGDPKTTNNVMELQAVIGGLESLASLIGAGKCDIEVISDSSYIINAFNDGWIVKWMLYGWRKSINGDIPRPNADVWQRLVALVSSIEAAGHTITWRHVNGHVGIPENEYCDKIAKQEKERVKIEEMSKACKHKRTEIIHVTLVAGMIAEKREVCKSCGKVLSLQEVNVNG
jgi:ribonuclease HI